MNKRYEYMVKTLTVFAVPVDDIERELNTIGADGWTLACTEPGQGRAMIFFFMRPIIDRSSPQT